jgi:DNA invertase Pin-like site-specific DNA recombinase
VRAERVKAGQAAARANGVRWGGSEAGRYVNVKPEQEKAVLSMKANGEKIVTIARVTGLSKPTIYGVLRNHNGEA